MRLPGRMPDHLVIHCGHHKVLTVYFQNVLTAFCRHFDLTLVNTASGEGAGSPAPDVMLVHDSDMSRIPVGDFRGTHVIRDPRDVLVSAYRYHLRTDEHWCVNPDSAFEDLPRGVSYQQHLKSLDEEAGLVFEMTHIGGVVIRDMAEWNYGDPRFLELRYEEILGNEGAVLEKAFRWWGFRGFPAWIGRAQALRFRRARVARRPGFQHGAPDSRVGQWRYYFTPTVEREFKRRWGGTVVALGYEDGDDWSATSA